MLRATRVTSPQTERSDGFSLIELILSIGILGVVFSVLSLVMVTALKSNQETEDRLDETRDEQFVAAYFATDMAGATQVIPGGAAQCGADAAVVTLVGESFVPVAASSAAGSDSTATVAAYVFSTTTVDGVLTGTLTRAFCEGTGNPPFAVPLETTALAARLAPAAPLIWCVPGGTAAACSRATTRLSVEFARLDGGQFTLSGTRRAAP